MNTHADKTTKAKSNAVANGMAVQQGVAHEIFQLEDGHAQTNTQRNIQDAANSSLQVKQLKTIQSLANNSPQVKQLKAVQAMADGHTIILQKTKPVLSNIIQKVNVTSFWFQGALGHTGSMSEFRRSIGEDTFQEFLKYDIEEVTPLFDFITKQKLNYTNAKKQFRVLAPYVKNPVKLDILKEILIATEYDTTVAPLIYDYWVKYKGDGEIIFKLAKRILYENENNVDESEKSMMVIKTQIRQSAQTDAFEKAWTTDTGKKINQDLDAKEAKAFILKDSGSKLAAMFPEIVINARDAQSINRDKIKNAKKTTLDKLGVVETNIQKIIAPMIDVPSGIEIISWCLDTAKTDLEKLQSFVTFLRSSFDQRILYQHIGPLVKGKENKLFAFITLWEEDSISKLPPLIWLATIPTLELLLVETGNDFGPIYDWLVTKDMSIDDIKILLSKNFESDVFVALLSWSDKTKLLIKLSDLAPDKPTFEKLVTEINGEKTAIKDLIEALETDGTDWQTIEDVESVKEQVKNFRMAQGLLGENDTVIDTMDKTKIVGDGLTQEQKAVTDALKTKWKHTSGVCENRGKHRNDNGHLPFKPGVGNYIEWGILPPTSLWPGGRRLIQDVDNGHIYYTWTHYGENGNPAFVLLT